MSSGRSLILMPNKCVSFWSTSQAPGSNAKQMVRIPITSVMGWESES